jgi:hypothetical protein
VYCAAVMDAYSRLIVGWSIADGCGSSGVTVSVPVGGRDLGDGSGVGSAGFGV